MTTKQETQADPAVGAMYERWVYQLDQQLITAYKRIKILKEALEFYTYDSDGGAIASKALDDAS